MGKTYFIDVDGTIVGYKTWDELREFENLPLENVNEVLLPGVKKFWEKILPEDKIIITTARYESHRMFTEKIFRDNGLRFDMLIMNLPNGPRILINDTPDILKEKAIAINVKRDGGFF